MAELQHGLLRCRFKAALLQCRLLQHTGAAIAHLCAFLPLRIPEGKDEARHVQGHISHTILQGVAGIPLKAVIVHINRSIVSAALNLIGIQHRREDLRNPPVDHLGIDHPVINQRQTVIDISLQQLLHRILLNAPLEGQINIIILFKVFQHIEVERLSESRLCILCISKIQIYLSRKALSIGCRQSLQQSLIEPVQPGAVTHCLKIHQVGIRVLFFTFQKRRRKLFHPGRVRQNLLQLRYALLRRLCFRRVHRLCCSCSGRRGRRHFPRIGCCGLLFLRLLCHREAEGDFLLAGVGHEVEVAGYHVSVPRLPAVHLEAELRAHAAEGLLQNPYLRMAGIRQSLQLHPVLGNQQQLELSSFSCRQFACEGGIGKPEPGCLKIHEAPGQLVDFFSHNSFHSVSYYFSTVKSEDKELSASPISAPLLRTICISAKVKDNYSAVLQHEGCLAREEVTHDYRTAYPV